MTENREPEVVYSGSVTEAHLVQACLEDAGIEAMLWDEEMAHVNLAYVAPAGVGIVKVVVPHEDVEKAVEALKRRLEESAANMDVDDFDDDGPHEDEEALEEAPEEEAPKTSSKKSTKKGAKKGNKK